MQKSPLIVYSIITVGAKWKLEIKIDIRSSRGECNGNNSSYCGDGAPLKKQIHLGWGDGGGRDILSHAWYNIHLKSDLKPPFLHNHIVPYTNVNWNICFVLDIYPHTIGDFRILLISADPTSARFSEWRHYLTWCIAQATMAAVHAPNTMFTLCFNP